MVTTYKETKNVPPKTPFLPRLLWWGNEWTVHIQANTFTQTS